MLFLLLRITVDGFSKTDVGPMILEEAFMDKTLKKTYHPLDMDGMSVVAVDSIKISEMFSGQVWHSGLKRCWIWMCRWRSRLPKFGTESTFVSSTCSLRRLPRWASTLCQAQLMRSIVRWSRLSMLFTPYYGFKHMVLSCRSWLWNTLSNPVKVCALMGQPLSSQMLLFNLFPKYASIIQFIGREKVLKIVAQVPPPAYTVGDLWVMAGESFVLRYNRKAFDWGTKLPMSYHSKLIGHHVTARPTLTNYIITDDKMTRWHDDISCIQA